MISVKPVRKCNIWIELHFSWNFLKSNISGQVEWLKAIWNVFSNIISNIWWWQAKYNKFFPRWRSNNLQHPFFKSVLVAVVSKLIPIIFLAIFHSTRQYILFAESFSDSSELFSGTTWCSDIELESWRNELLSITSREFEFIACEKTRFWFFGCKDGKSSNLCGSV